MVEALKKLDKKFLILAGIIILLPILLIIFLAIIQGCEGRKSTHEEYENKMIIAAEKYLEREGSLPKAEGEIATVKLSKLVDKGYIKSSEKSVDDASCDGSVTARMNGASIDSNKGGYINYTVNLECDKYSTKTFNSVLKENIVTTESGLYEFGDGYVFKGNKANNYINFYGVDYRIMSIDENGIMKLIKIEPEVISRMWDNKFNVEVNHSYGKTIYKDSVILTYLLNDYTNSKKFTSKAKSHLVAHDVCVGKRNKSDISINHELDCSEIFEKQLISLINVSDYAIASTDENCDSIVSRSCTNYNYLSSVSTSTWTMNGVLDNTYEAYYIADGMAYTQNANSYNEYNIVIYVDGNEKYTEGNGSSTSPYVIK